MHLVPSGQLGGGEETVRLLAQFLDPSRFRVSVVCPESPLMESLAQIPGVARLTARFPKMPTPGAVSRIAALIERERPDIVHTHLFHGDLHGLLAVSFRRRPARLLATVQGVNF